MWPHLPGDTNATVTRFGFWQVLTSSKQFRSMQRWRVLAQNSLPSSTLEKLYVKFRFSAENQINEKNQIHWENEFPSVGLSHLWSRAGRFHSPSSWCKWPECPRGLPPSSNFTSSGHFATFSPSTWWDQGRVPTLNRCPAKLSREVHTCAHMYLQEYLSNKKSSFLATDCRRNCQLR